MAITGGKGENQIDDDKCVLNRTEIYLIQVLVI